MTHHSAPDALHRRPAELLQQLLRFDTTNPPGNERDCILFVHELLSRAGIESGLYARQESRPNLVARLEGDGRAPALLVQGHVDVVTTENQSWARPPFGGDLVDGWVWGRGALDMKGGVAMMLSALLRAKHEGLSLPGDVVLAVVSDEEAGGDMGARFLVEEHPELFEGVRYAIGELGGFRRVVAGKRLYFIQVDEKQLCWMRAKLRGRGGHGSVPVRGGAMASLGRFLVELDQRRLPVHVTPVVRRMVHGMASAVGGVRGAFLRLLLQPALTDRILDLAGEQGRVLYPLFHNTVSPTILDGGNKVNVIPGEVSVELDGRLLPRYRPEDLVREIRGVAGEDVEIEVLRHDSGPSEPDMGLFDTLADLLRETDPTAVAVPLLLSGVTDGRHFARLGIQSYGFLPMPLPDDFDFASVIHAADERIPVETVEFGSEILYRLLGRFG